MRLLFARNDMPLELKAGLIEVGVFVVLWFLVLTLSAGPFGEHFARSWLLALILAVMPINRLPMHWAKRLLFASVVGITIMTIQGVIAYEVRQYSPTGDVSNAWTLASIVAYVAMSGVAWASGRYFTGRLPCTSGF